MSKTFWQFVGRKYRLVVNGSEEPLRRYRLVHSDNVLEDAVARHSNSVVPIERRRYFKECYQQRKSHDKLIEHNKKIRQLDKRIKAGLYDNWDYANKW